MRKKAIFANSLLILLFPVWNLAQEGNTHQGKSQSPRPEIEQENRYSTPYVLRRLSGLIIFDGLIDEPAWEEIEPLLMVMHMPHFGSEPTEKTTVLVSYNDDYLYVGACLYDSEPEKILASSKKRDYMKGDTDWFGFIIDSFNDKENALGFFTTPTGLRHDSAVFNDAQGDFPVNLSWNTFWDVKTSRNEEGWFAEFRVPFSSLRFQDEDGRVVMGLICWRWIAHKNEVVTFPKISPEWGGWSFWKPSLAQEIIFEDVFSKKPLYVAPYILGGFGLSFELNEAETAYERRDDPALEAGLDIKYGITSNLTLDITVNTDFAQVEADDQQINLTRFSLFFPEKRVFFQERASIFDFNFGDPNRLFYSRRIGIHEGESVRIYGGARLVGRVGTWDLGLLNMQTALVEDLTSENFGVFRIRRRVFNPYSYVGGIVTSRIGTNGSYNVAYGLDGIFRIFADDYLSLIWAQTFENGKKNSPASLEPARLRINWERRTFKGFGYNFGLSRSGKDYSPGVGFEMREDFTRFGNRIHYGWIPGEKSFLWRHHVFLEGFLFLRNKDDLAESVEVGPGWSLETKSGYTANIAAKFFYEDVSETFSLSDDADVPEGQYRFYGLNGMLMSPMGRVFSTEVTLDAGSFYDGWKISFSTSPNWSLSSDFELSGTYLINWVEFPQRHQKFISHVGRLRFMTTLSTEFSASAFIQYNSAINVIIANIRLRYNPREGVDLYLVYNEGLNTNRYRETPSLPLTSSRTVMVKYSYTFNF